MSINYVDYDYWEYGYAYGDIRFIEASATVNANVSLIVNGVAIYSRQAVVSTNATVSTDYIRIRFNNADVTAYADITANGGVVYDGTASVLTSAQVTSDSIRYRLVTGDIAGSLSFTAEGYSDAIASASIFNNVTFSANGYLTRYAIANITVSNQVTTNGYLIRLVTPSINATANVTAYPRAIWNGIGNAMSSNLSVTALGTVLGEEWSDSAVGNEVWNWVSNPLYVEIGYWDNDYVFETDALWTDSPSSSNVWLRQG